MISHAKYYNKFYLVLRKSTHKCVTCKYKNYFGVLYTYIVMHASIMCKIIIRFKYLSVITMYVLICIFCCWFTIQKLLRWTFNVINNIKYRQLISLIYNRFLQNYWDNVVLMKKWSVFKDYTMHMYQVVALKVVVYV